MQRTINYRNWHQPTVAPLVNYIYFWLLLKVTDFFYQSEAYRWTLLVINDLKLYLVVFLIYYQITKSQFISTATYFDPPTWVDLHPISSSNFPSKLMSTGIELYLSEPRVYAQTAVLLQFAREQVQQTKKKRAYTFTLPHCTYNLYKNSFLLRCLFRFVWFLWCCVLHYLSWCRAYCTSSYALLTFDE